MLATLCEKLTKNETVSCLAPSLSQSAKVIGNGILISLPRNSNIV